MDNVDQLLDFLSVLKNPQNDLSPQTPSSEADSIPSPSSDDDTEHKSKQDKKSQT